MTRRQGSSFFKRGDYISCANCGLHYSLGGTIREREKLFVETPESFRKTLDVDVRISTEVTDINPETKTVGVRERRSGREYRKPYDALILSPGAEPLRPPIPGIDFIPPEEGVTEDFMTQRPSREQPERESF